MQILYPLAEKRGLEPWDQDLRIWASMRSFPRDCRLASSRTVRGQAGEVSFRKEVLFSPQAEARVPTVMT